MSKTEFLAALRTALGKLPEQEIRASLDFYAEVIDDRVEDGATEEEAVAALGDVNAIAAQIIAETPPIPKAVAKMKTSSRTANIVLAVVLSPIWVPLALAFAVCVAAIYLSLWMAVAALWLCVACLLLCGPIGIIGLVWCLATGFPLTGLWLLGCGLAGSGLGLFALLGMKTVSRGLVQLTGMFARSVKSLFVKRPDLSGVKEKANAAAGRAREAAAEAADGVRARVHAATAPRADASPAAEICAKEPQSDAKHTAPTPPPGYVATPATQPTADPASQPARPEGGDHDDRA